MPWSFDKKWELVDRYVQAGYSGLTVSLANEETSTEQALDYLARVRKHIFSHPDKYILAKTADDIRKAKRENKIEVVELLLQRNYSEPEIKGILGENILRVM